MAPPFSVRSLLFLLFGVCPLLFFTDLTRNPYYTQIALLNIFVCLLWMVWVVKDWRLGALTWRQSVLDLPFLALIGISLISWIASMVSHRTMVLPIYSEGSKNIIFLLINTWLVYAAAIRARDRALYRRLVLLTYGVSTLASIYAVAQYFGQEWIWPRALNPYGSRPVSTFGNPNFLSTYLAAVIPVMAGDYLFRCTRTPRVILLAALLINTGAILATLTRSSWAGLAVGLALLLWQVRQDPRLRRQAASWFAALLIGLTCMVMLWPRNSGTIYSATVASRLGEIREAGRTTYGPVWQRFLIWRSAWSMVEDHPWLGKGWGCFELFYPYYQGRQLFDDRLRGLRTHANNAHNEVLEYWSQIGGVGLGLMIWLWFVFFRSALSVGKRLEESWRPLQAGLVGGVAAVLVDNLLNVSAHFAVPAFIFWWWVGMALALDPQEPGTRVLVAKPLPRAVLASLIVLLLAVGATRAYAFWQAEVHFFEGFKKSKGGVDLVGAQKELERSFAWHPLEVNNAYELGNVYARTGQRDKAADMYGRALDANAGYDEIFFNRGTVMMQMDRDRDALRHYRICLAINPLSREAYNAMASLYLKDVARYGADLEAAYRQAVTVFPDDRDFWNNLGWLYTQQQQWARAQDAYQQALRVDPNFELARRNLQAVSERVRFSAGH